MLSPVLPPNPPEQKMSTESPRKSYDWRLRLMAAGLAVGTVALGVSNLAASLQLESPWLVAVDIVILLGWITFAGALISATGVEEEEEEVDPELQEARAMYIRGRSFAAGFIAMMVVQVLILVADAVLMRTAGASLEVGFIATFSIAVGLLFSLLRFIQLDRQV
jgi:hypothetical protein